MSRGPSARDVSMRHRPRAKWYEVREMSSQKVSQQNKVILEQKRALITAFQRSGNMTQAMRVAGIRNRRTAYLWWRR